MIAAHDIEDWDSNVIPFPKARACPLRTNTAEVEPEPVTCLMGAWLQVLALPLVFSLMALHVTIHTNTHSLD